MRRANLDALRMNAQDAPQSQVVLQLLRSGAAARPYRLPRWLPVSLVLLVAIAGGIVGGVAWETKFDASPPAMPAQRRPAAEPSRGLGGRSSPGSPSAKAKAATTSSPGQPAAPQPGDTLAVVQGVEYQQSGGHLHVTIDLGKMVAFAAHTAQSPSRVYIDLFGARLSPKLARTMNLAVARSGAARPAASANPVRSIRAADHEGGRSRIVFDLKSECRYTVEKSANPPRLLIDIGS